MQRTYTPKAAADMIGVSVSTLRNWCGLFGEYLSADATPAAGQERKLSAGDVAILQRVKELRDQGMTTEAIVATLESEDLTALQQPYIDAAIVPTEPQEAPQKPPEAIMTVDMVTTLIEASEARYSALEGKLERMEARQADRFQWFALGALFGVLVVLVLLLIVWLGMAAGGNW